LKIPELLPAIILIRGLPGAGKSSLANILSEEGVYPVFSVDDYFTNPFTGEYNFVFSENHIAYKTCLDKVELSMQNKIKKIFVHNTLTLDWEINEYFKLSSKHRYAIFVVTCENYHSNKSIHSVSDEQLIKMANKYKVKLF
jgi:adenylate kinase family enzyme